jgi:hypothetical protein
MTSGKFIGARLQLEKDCFPQGVTPDGIRMLDAFERVLEVTYQLGLEEAAKAGPEQWSNQSALGYTILAAERTGLPDETIHRLVRSMRVLFDRKSLETAAEYYRRSAY